MECMDNKLNSLCCIIHAAMNAIFIHPSIIIFKERISYAPRALSKQLRVYTPYRACCHVLTITKERTRPEFRLVQSTHYNHY